MDYILYCNKKHNCFASMTNTKPYIMALYKCINNSDGNNDKSSNIVIISIRLIIGMQYCGKGRLLTRPLTDSGCISQLKIQFPIHLTPNYLCICISGYQGCEKKFSSTLYRRGAIDGP